MRLLNTSTLQVEDIVGQQVPEYVILSHTWEEEEVTLQDIERGTATNKKGYTKIKRCCEKAADDGFLYCWIDTCCIDKTSSAELSEAINSMYQWYKKSRICYAYLADFEDDSESVMDSYRGFTKSRWWTRGWTLQELLAPNIVEFYTADWVEVGTKLSLQEQITEITGIDGGVLRGTDPFRRNVAVRMSWAAHRKTSRIEDQAYCLMGLFGVNMPLLYGEGNRAFLRLQEEIMRVREDYTLFSWAPTVVPTYAESQLSKGLLASSPSDFLESNHEWMAKKFPTTSTPIWSFRDLSRDCTSLLLPPNDHDPPFLTSRGLRISLPLLQRDSGEVYACITLLRISDQEEMILCIPLHRLSPKSERYIRRMGNGLILFPRNSRKGFKYKSIYVMQPPPHLDYFDIMSGMMETTSPSLLIAKSRTQQGNPPKFYFSSFLGLDRLIAARFGADSLNDPLASSHISASTASNSLESGNLYLHRLNKLTNETIHMKRDDLLSLAMNIPPELCWFSDGRSRTSGKRGALGFANEDYPTGAFVIQLGLFEDRPLCNVISATVDDMQDGANHRTWIENAQIATLQYDRATIYLKQEAGGGEASIGLAVTVGIRQVASAFGISRYLLSITQQSISPSASFELVRRSETMSTWASIGPYCEDT